MVPLPRPAPPPFPLPAPAGVLATARPYHSRTAAIWTRAALIVRPTAAPCTTVPWLAARASWFRFRPIAFKAIRIPRNSATPSSKKSGPPVTASRISRRTTRLGAMPNSAPSACNPASSPARSRTWSICECAALGFNFGRPIRVPPLNPAQPGGAAGHFVRKKPGRGFLSNKLLILPTIKNTRNIPQSKKDTKRRIKDAHERRPQSARKSKSSVGSRAGKKRTRRGTGTGAWKPHFRKSPRSTEISPVLAPLDPFRRPPGGEEGKNTGATKRGTSVG